MSSGTKPVVPTLTEVIEVATDQRAGPVPLAPESIPLESLDGPPAVAGASPRLVSQQALVDAVVQRLQPTLDIWIEAHAAGLIAEALRGPVEEAARALARALSAELPGLARDALDELQKDIAARSPPRV